MSGPSPTLVAVTLGDADAADAALASLRELASDGVDVRDAAVVRRTPHGRIELQQTRQMAAGEGVVAGGSVGLLAGLLLGLPVVGALVGLLGGVGFGLRDTGIPDRRLRKLGKALAPGAALVAVLVEPAGAARARAALAPYGAALDTGTSAAAEP